VLCSQGAGNNSLQQLGEIALVVGIAGDDRSWFRVGFAIPAESLALTAAALRCGSLSARYARVAGLRRNRQSAIQHITARPALKLDDPIAAGRAPKSNETASRWPLCR
jgi:hypothetical protein